MVPSSPSGGAGSGPVIVPLGTGQLLCRKVVFLLTRCEGGNKVRPCLSRKRGGAVASWETDAEGRASFRPKESFFLTENLYGLHSGAFELSVHLPGCVPCSLLKSLKTLNNLMTGAIVTFSEVPVTSVVFIFTVAIGVILPSSRNMKTPR